MFVKPKIKYVKNFNKSMYEVYEIGRNNKTGFPKFLIYDDNRWVFKSAKYFEPIDSGDIQRRVS